MGRGLAIDQVGARLFFEIFHESGIQPGLGGIQVNQLHRRLQILGRSVAAEAFAQFENTRGDSDCLA